MASTTSDRFGRLLLLGWKKLKKTPILPDDNILHHVFSSYRRQWIKAHPANVIKCGTNHHPTPHFSPYPTPHSFLEVLARFYGGLFHPVSVPIGMPF